MLRFTPEQTAAVIAARELFNNQQEVLGANIPAAAGPLVGNAIGVPLDAWRRIDQDAAQIQRDELVVFNRLAAASQTPVGVGDLVSFFGKVSNSGGAHVSMDGRSKAKGDQATMVFEGTPVPVIDDYATFGWRQMEVIRKNPMGMDTAAIDNSQRTVAEMLEDMALNGRPSIKVGNATIYGLRTFPDRNTNTHGLDLNGATGAQWVAVFKALVQALTADKAYGRITAFINYDDWTYASLTDYAAGYPKTILQRLLEIAQVEEIVPVPRLPANEVCGIANIKSRRWGSILQAMPMTTQPEQRANPKDEYRFGVFAMAAPQFRSDYEGRSQLAHLTRA